MAIVLFVEQTSWLRFSWLSRGVWVFVESQNRGRWSVGQAFVIYSGGHFSACRQRKPQSWNKKQKCSPAPVPHTFRTWWRSAWLITLRARPVWLVSFIMRYQQSRADHHCIIYLYQILVLRKCFTVIIHEQEWWGSVSNYSHIYSGASRWCYHSLWPPAHGFWTEWDMSIVGKGKGWQTRPSRFSNTPPILAFHISIHLCVLDNGVRFGRGCPAGLDSPTFACS